MDKRKNRFFNTTGPCNPEDHYMLPPEERLVGTQLHRYIGDKLYWVLHAPRQTGKTTFLQSWMREINSGSEAVSCYVSVETCQGVPEAERAIPIICDAVRRWAEKNDLPVPAIEDETPQSQLNSILGNWAKLTAPKPLIVLFDEVDVLQGDALISFLRQLRDGFAGRGVEKFPVSIALVGMRDLKDYITAAKGGVPVNPGSPFNIKADSGTLSNFQKDDIARLFAQRTAETGQQITPEALDYVYDQSRGQPWLVNSLFMRATMRILDGESTEPVTIEHIREAREQMIQARETHLDALAYRLENPQIRSVMETLITGEPDPLMAQGEAFRLCMDLGLVAIEKGGPVVANPIYREVIAREITFGAQMAIPAPEWKWQKSDGTLDMDALLREFQAFWQNNSEIWEQKLDYPEAFPHLLLMAFLQRVTNGHGRIEREYAAGRGRMDLAVEYNGAWNIIEIKLLRQGRNFETVMAEGLKQTLGYRDNFFPIRPSQDRNRTEASCYLLIFDRRLDKPAWSERLKWITTEAVTVLGC
ncbi:PD-(D/E)XK nuclease domain-containing protein [Treponema primitia]|uniref:ATP-binding protein n=1 Tax=Treponema primitia TaxID=88058 RepID=UPI00397F4F12